MKYLLFIGLVAATGCKSTSESSLKQGHQATNQTYHCDHTLIRGDYKVTYQLKFVYSGKKNELSKARMQVAGIEKGAKKHSRSGKCMTSCKTWEDKREMSRQGDTWLAFRDDSSPVFSIPHAAVTKSSGRFADFSIVHHAQPGEGIDNVMIPISGGSCRVAYTAY